MLLVLLTGMLYFHHFLFAQSTSNSHIQQCNIVEQDSKVQERTLTAARKDTDSCNTLDIDTIYSNFLNVIHSLIADCIPKKSVVVGPRDPDFVTPLVKALLNKRNRLRRCGKIEAAN